MFLIFAGYDYYPRGGWNDFIGSFSTLQEAEEAAKNVMAVSCGETFDKDWLHIVSLEMNRIVVKAYKYYNVKLCCCEISWERLL